MIDDGPNANVKVSYLGVINGTNAKLTLNPKDIIRKYTTFLRTNLLN